MMGYHRDRTEMCLRLVCAAVTMTDGVSFVSVFVFTPVSERRTEDFLAVVIVSYIAVYFDDCCCDASLLSYNL